MNLWSICTIACRWSSIDADARRFWRRVFRLVRIPGGRYLLKVLGALEEAIAAAPAKREVHHKNR